jgi:hypothetical protein
MEHHPFTVLFARSAPPSPDRHDVAAVHRDQRFNGGPLLITHRSTCARGDRIGGHAGWSAPGEDGRARTAVTRYTQPEPELQLPLQQLKLQLPPQPLPKSAPPPSLTPPDAVKTFSPISLIKNERSAKTSAKTG